MAPDKKAELKALLIKAGIDYGQIAQRCNVARTTVRVVVNGHQASRPIRRALAEAVGRPVTYFWPEEASPEHA